MLLLVLDSRPNIRWSSAYSRKSLASCCTRAVVGLYLVCLLTTTAVAKSRSAVRRMPPVPQPFPVAALQGRQEKRTSLPQLGPLSS